MNACARTELVLPETYAPPRPRRTAQRGDERPLVFLAEDDVDLRTILGFMLRREGFDVFAATDGDDLLSILSASSRGGVRAPDALVLDVRMPFHGGDEIVGALRRAGWTLPIVLMTGFASAATRARAEEDGASAVVEKPMDAHDLAALLLELLGETSACEPADEDDRVPDTLRSPALALSQGPAVRDDCRRTRRAGGAELT